MATVTIGTPGRTPVRIDGLDVDILMTYRDSRGAESDRRLTLHTVSGWMGTLGTIEVQDLRGYCHKRNMPRTFMYRRITQIADPRTGEIIPDLLAWLPLPAG